MHFLDRLQFLIFARHRQHVGKLGRFVALATESVVKISAYVREKPPFHAERLQLPERLPLLELRDRP